MKNKFMIGTVLTGILFTASPVEAMGNANITFASNTNIKVGETFTVTMNVTDIKDTYDGIVSMGGNLSFDNTKLEYVSSVELNAPYKFYINESYNYKIAGLDTTLENGINKTTNIYEFTFKAIEEGNTSITLENAKLTDSQNYIDTTVISKNIIIEKQVQPIIKNKVIEGKENPIIKEIINNGSDKIEETVDVIETNVENTSEVKNEVNEEREKEIFIIRFQKLFNGLITNFKKMFN